MDLFGAVKVVRESVGHKIELMIATNPNSDDGAAFNAHGLAELSVGFDFGAVDHDEEPGESSARSSREITVRLLHWLSLGNPNPAEIGRRVIALQHLINPEASQKLLAKRLRVSKGKASTRLQKLREKLRGGTLRNLFSQ